MKYGSIWARIGGGLIDLLIVIIITGVVVFCWGLIVGLGGKEAHLSQALQKEIWSARGFIVGIIVDALYTIGMQASANQATYGQKASDLVIVKSDGSKPSASVIVARYLLSLISSVLIKIGYVVAIFTKRKQTLHDLISDTVVIEKNDFTNQIKTKKNEKDLQEESEVENSWLKLTAILVAIILFMMMVM
jgi:uncharacterized RDD family membrane protein YckC